MRLGIKIVPIAAPLAAASLAALALVAAGAPAQAAFGAFAHDEATGKYGASWNEPTEKAAEEAALKGCASEKCKVVFRTKGGQCGVFAMTENGKIWGGATRAKKDVAEKAALENCQKRVSAGTQCKVRVSECNK
jgi:hypothetical protein